MTAGIDAPTAGRGASTSGASRSGAASSGGSGRHYPYAAYSELAGPVEEVPGGRPYTVRYRPVGEGGSRGLRTFALTGTALVVEVGFFAWLMNPAHWPDQAAGTWTYALSMVMVTSIGLIELMRVVNVATLALATVVARDPVPVRPQPGLHVAFITTIVPGKEPVAMVRATLEAARAVRHDGALDVWLLDEGDDPDVRAMCADVGVRHFSRRGVERWNRASGPHRARTKHGNYNAWLDAHGDEYDVLVSVDPDHVPLVNFAERLLGYFRDPDVAFVVGPQVYGNYDNFITRSAESQQYLFHSVLQRAANAYQAAMLVGTNNAMRISALKAIGGLQDSITEDAATSMTLHASRNPATGRKWKSVYTPDVLAVGEGPSSWTDYFSQQHRWARGTNEVVLGRFWRSLPHLSPGRALHYGLLMSYYPSAALAWVLGCTNAVLYLTTGVGGVQVAAQLWLMLYVDAAVLQLGLYFWNRTHNTSPHEEEGSSGIAGMFVSVLSAPVYVTALVQGLLRRDASFVVTPKGDSMSPDRVLTFRKNLQWTAVLALALAASVPLGHDHAAMRTWAVASLAITLCPLAIWALGPGRRGPRPPAVIDLREIPDLPAATAVATAQETAIQKTAPTSTPHLEKTP